MVHRKEIIKKVGDWDEKLRFWEDWEFTLRISRFYPKGFLYLNRALVNYEQTLDFQNKRKTIKEWEKAEKYIYEKHKDHPLIKNIQWYPPKIGYKSTLNVIEYLKKKKEGK